MCEISIIVPVYNVERYLDRCIKSILNQTFKNFELILVDDGSPDGCGKICDNYARIDSRIRVIHKENGGLSSARNAGLDIARGKYIGFVDSDDYIHERMYEILLKEAENNSSDIVICKFKEVFDNIKIDEEINENIDIYNFNNVEALGQLYGSNAIDFVVSWNKIYDKRIFESERYKEGKLNEDEFIIHKLLYKSNRVTFISKELYYYFQRNDSIMQSKFNIKRLDAVYALEERMRFFEDLNLEELKENAQYCYIRVFFAFFFRAKSNLNNCEYDLRELKKRFIYNIPRIINNNKCNIKEKILWIIFIISPKVYEVYNKRSWK